MLRRLSLIALSLSAPAAALAPSDPPSQDPEAAIEAVRRGDLREARAVLAELIVEQNVTAAERLVAEGSALDALVLLDEALELRPQDAELLYRRATAAYAAAPQSSQPGFLYEDALEHFLAARDAGYGVRAVLDASRAARRVPAPERALELARSGAARLARMEEPPAIDPPVERTWAEAAFDSYLERLRDQQPAEELFHETEGKLEELLARTPEDPWPLQQLANLYDWEGRSLDAIARLERAIELAPDEQDVHERLMELVPREQGWPALVEYYEGLRTMRPTARPVRNLAWARFHAALERYDAGEVDPGAFRAAEADFRAARELDAAWESDCLGFEVVCRDAAGWSHFRLGQLSEAKEAFLSMEDLFEGGLAWSLPGRLRDGIDGLASVVGALIQNPNELGALDQMVEAAAITDHLHAYRPDDPGHANNAGFVDRDTAVLFERKSDIVRHQAAQSGDPEERAALEREATRLRARAQELMRKSWEAYRVAARLAPDDVRVQNDAGLVQAYYLRDDPDAAEEYFLRAVELGTAQIDDPGLSEEDRENLNEAWGDAHQNLFVLELTQRRNPAAAKAWLEKALAIGPPSREWLRPMLATCDRLAAGESIDLATTDVGRMVWLHNPRK